jgi:hypothetical protein
MPTRTIAYLRVSTDKQADRGVSLDAQRAKATAYAELYDLELVEVIVDAGESAKSLDRPGLKRALGMLKAGEAEALLVVKLDRLTRSVVDLGTLLERYFAPGKAALLSVGEQIDTRSAAGRLVLNVLASVSQWEREAIGERVTSSTSDMVSSNRMRVHASIIPVAVLVAGGYDLISGQRSPDVQQPAGTVAFNHTSSPIRGRCLHRRRLPRSLSSRWAQRSRPK